ncbi:tyrosine-type recombinase/integrase [Streptococcus agalactiae]|uniref:tyrosine-type recombinase/integrase n=1 Tax=Streptococcus agalactiae TaxID=1311 RepID=UPI0025552332|nr:tyrosine-type recombinase/integrase [Streptococcus agalactiae]MDK8747549.1 tyrosine-type recombinase/integrase [Streptococcus agalactiae]
MKFVQPIRDKEILQDIKKYLKNKNERDYILFSIGIYTGLRISDILELRVKDLKDKEHLTIQEKKTKNRKKNKQRIIKVHPKLQKELKVFLKEKSLDDYVIKSRQGNNKPITRERAYGILQDIAKEFNLQSVGTHTLRKTFGYNIYQQSKNVALLQEMFNHSDPAITLRYIGINQDTMDFAIDKIDF